MFYSVHHIKYFQYLHVYFLHCSTLKAFHPWGKKWQKKPPKSCQPVLRYSFVKSFTCSIFNAMQCQLLCITFTFSIKSTVWTIILANKNSSNQINNFWIILLFLSQKKRTFLRIQTFVFLKFIPMLMNAPEK